jgi:hypothetical protein
MAGGWDHTLVDRWGGRGVIITVAGMGSGGGGSISIENGQGYFNVELCFKICKNRDCLTHLGISHVLNHRFTYSYNCSITV